MANGRCADHQDRKPPKGNNRVSKTSGKPICGATVDRCQKARGLYENGRCKSHGGKNEGHPLIHGRKSEKLKKLIQTREQFLQVLGGDNSNKIYGIIDKLHQLATGDKPNLEAIKYILDQLFGGPKSTIITEIGDQVLFAKFVRVTARHLKGEAFQAWLSDLKQDIETASDSTT